MEPLKMLLCGDDFITYDQTTWETVRKAIGEHDRPLLRQWNQQEDRAGIDGQYIGRVARAVMRNGYKLLLA